MEDPMPAVKKKVGSVTTKAAAPARRTLALKKDAITDLAAGRNYSCATRSIYK
jgi:hypothetical protein